MTAIPNILFPCSLIHDMFTFKVLCFPIIWIFICYLCVTYGQTNITKSPIIRKCENETCIPIHLCREAIEKLANKLYEPVRSMFCGFNGSTPQVCCKTPKEDTDGLVFNDDLPSYSQLEAPKKQVVSEEPALRQPELPPKRSILPSRHICGTLFIPERIVGGEPTELKDLPWTALLQYETKGTVSYLCGGSLITNIHVLTAAHCVHLLGNLELKKVILGEWDIETEADCKDKLCNMPPVEAEIDSIILHEEYNRKKLNHDIAIIKLKSPVNFTDFIQPVCLPDTEDVASKDYIIGSKYTTAGWGITEFHQPSPVKRKVDLNAVALRKCNNSRLVNDENAPYVICAGGKKGEDTCEGDSGGPLIKQVIDDNQSTNWYLFGITSAGARKCGTEGQPSLFTRIVPHMEWIQSKL